MNNLDLIDEEFLIDDRIIPEPEEMEPAAALARSNGSIEFTRRGFIKLLGAGLLITVAGDRLFAQGRGRGRRGPETVAMRVHVGADGTITVMCGKVEEGQGPRGEIALAAAEELRVSPERIQVVLADTALVPNDGITAGSGTTPRTIPSIRRACAAAREILIGLACAAWQAQPAAVEVSGGVIRHKASQREVTYAELAKDESIAESFAKDIPGDIVVTHVNEWKTLGTALARPNLREIVTGRHQYPSDIIRPKMLYGKVLRPPSYGATLAQIDLAPAQALPDVVVLRDGEFVGCAAPTSFQAAQAIEALEKTAVWNEKSGQPSHKELYAHLKEHAGSDGGGRGGRSRGRSAGSVADGLAAAAKTLQATFEIAYIQHTALEPRAATAEWEGDRLTVWAGTDNPFGVRAELARGLGVSADNVRVIVPDMGGGFGGKHDCDPALEAARLARAAGRPVAVRWTRAEEFTWAYFRPAGVIEARAGLDANGGLSAWEFTNINSGGASIDTPYRVPNVEIKYVRSDSPLKSGSYRSLASTANNFARESLMDELALAAGADPLEFRLKLLENERIAAVLRAAAEKFGWAERRSKFGISAIGANPAAGKHDISGADNSGKNSGAAPSGAGATDGVRKTGKHIGVGLACGTDKNSVVAACVEVEVDLDQGKISVREVCQAFECGPILNPGNLRSQVEGALIMGLGGALSEEILFADGKLLNASLNKYRLPRFADVPHLDILLLNRPDLESAGAGETPIIAIAPAIANAVFHASGHRPRSLPLRFPVTVG